MVAIPVHRGGGAQCTCLPSTQLGLVTRQSAGLADLLIIDSPGKDALDSIRLLNEVKSTLSNYGAYNMTMDKLRKRASHDPELTRKLNQAETFENLAYIAGQVGIDIEQSDFEAQNEELSEEELSNVSGGMRSVGGTLGIRKFMAKDGAHTCDTSTCTDCSSCGAHTCDTSTCKECNSCGASSFQTSRF